MLQQRNNNGTRGAKSRERERRKEGSGKPCQWLNWHTVHVVHMLPLGNTFVSPFLFVTNLQFRFFTLFKFICHLPISHRLSPTTPSPFCPCHRTINLKCVLNNLSALKSAVNRWVELSLAFSFYLINCTRAAAVAAAIKVNQHLFLLTLTAKQNNNKNTDTCHGCSAMGGEGSELKCWLSSNIRYECLCISPSLFSLASVSLSAYVFKLCVHVCVCVYLCRVISPAHCKSANLSKLTVTSRSYFYANRPENATQLMNETFTSIAKKEIGCIIQLVLIKPIEIGYAKVTDNTKRNAQLSGKQMRLRLLGAHLTCLQKNIIKILL